VEQNPLLEAILDLKTKKYGKGLEKDMPFSTEIIFLNNRKKEVK